MGALLFMGMIGSLAYGSYCIKKDIETGLTDYNTRPSMNKTTNKQTIQSNFKNICKRSGIQISSGGLPLNIKQCHKGIEYLQSQGFDEQSVQYFIELYEGKYNLLQQTQKNKIMRKHNKLLKEMQTGFKNTLIVFKREYYGGDEPQERMEKIMKNKLWSEMVEHYSYIRGIGTASFCEIWTLKVPFGFFTSDILDKKKNELYEEICWIEGIKNGNGW